MRVRMLISQKFQNKFLGRYQTVMIKKIGENKTIKLIQRETTRGEKYKMII